MRRERVEIAQSVNCVSYGVEEGDHPTVAGHRRNRKLYTG